ncbi:MAG TPA: 5'/3'-nucleotidase SurE [Bacteriovoracaceae bacterium]|nr:5'/3'-nucleotidase SurE [Bacteriovoracaceae bacterium]
MKILLSNDDGVNAPGIRSLFSELSKDHETTIIAPLEERSTTGHSLSLDKPLRLERIENNIYGCSGFPGDCVLMGLGHVLKDRRPDVVVSGINRGANLGQDLYYSGTVAAAREGAFHHVPSIAVSLAFETAKEVHHYDTAAALIKLCLDEGMAQACPVMTLININVPNVELSNIKGFRLTEVGFRHYSEEIHARIDARQREYYWIAGLYGGFKDNPKSDCQAVKDGYVAVTPHALIDRSSAETADLGKLLERLNAKFAV